MRILLTLWRERIIQIEETGKVPFGWIRESESWQTCACAEHEAQTAELVPMLERVA